jgi:hypothetical protein
MTRLVNRRDVPPEFWCHYPNMTSCACCGGILRLRDAILVTREITHCTRDTEHYCSHECAEKWAEIFHAEE